MSVRWIGVCLPPIGVNHPPICVYHWRLGFPWRAWCVDTTCVCCVCVRRAAVVVVCTIRHTARPFGDVVVFGGGLNTLSFRIS